MAFKIYTKTGDKGETSLANGQRVIKSHDLVEMYGTSDELNSAIGLAISFFPKDLSSEEILRIQNLLFELGSELAGFRKENLEESIILETDVEMLEKSIDFMQEKLPVLKSFILPGGSPASSFLHLARTICRRLERLMVKHKNSGGEIFDNSLKFVNRLSDYLFVLARYVNNIEGRSDILWKSRVKG
jgi:cob(I)alamin adenosyltransferase